MVPTAARPRSLLLSRQDKLKGRTIGILLCPPDSVSTRDNPVAVLEFESYRIHSRASGEYPAAPAFVAPRHTPFPARIFTPHPHVRILDQRSSPGFTFSALANLSVVLE